jgi:hypothetical protein
MIRFAPFAAIALAAFLLACAGEKQNLRDDPDFQAGYAAGCAAATTAGADFRRGPVKDEDMYANSEPYRHGWGTGYSACRGPNTPAPGGNPVPSPNPGS